MTVAEKKSPKEEFAQEFKQNFLKLSKSKRQRVAKLLPMWENCDDPQEAEELAIAIVEIVMPALVMPDAPGSAGPVSEDVDPAAQARVDAYHGDIGRKIMKLRDENGWTQEHLAQKSGLLQSHISRLEAGKHSPTRRTIKKIAEALGVRPSDIDLLFDD